MKAPYLLDCYKKEFDARVTKVKEGVFIVLDQTYFYPAGGGQPYDTGVITCNGNTYKIVFVKKEDGEIIHELSDLGLKEGDNIHGTIDWGRRYILMRYHTAAHILSEVISHATGALITGNQLEIDKARIDFSLENYEKDKVLEYITQANKIIKEAHPIHFSLLPRKEAETILGEKMTSLAKGFSEEIQEVRIVDIEGFGKEACGGTHLKNTAEVGEIHFVKAENKGKNNRRIVITLS
ncbi:MAG: alanyl-tRNA editing protein [bacterium]|nr:alanyl-tRNA editing protein [bacterium]